MFEVSRLPAAASVTCQEPTEQSALVRHIVRIVACILPRVSVLVVTMGPKEKRKLNRPTVELKKEVIAKHESGVRVCDLALQYGLPKSTISTWLKNREAIKAANVASGVTSVTSFKRPAILEEMEKLLMIFIKDKELAGDSISESVICAKALDIYKDLKKSLPEVDHGDFKASRGWFEKFKGRTGIHSVVRHGEASSADKAAAEKFVGEFGKFVDSEGYTPQQVFNCDETGLFWKRMPNRTFITKEEKALPGHKPMKDRLTLMLCANASGDFKVKPMLIYHSETPRAFTKSNVVKSKLPVFWRSNKKAWCTREYFCEWLCEVFAPQVREYLLEKHLPLKCLLTMDNAPAHPPSVQDVLIGELSFIQVMFLPKNTTSLLQPMDQQVISNFKKLYTKQMFQKCFEVTNDTDLTLKDFWKSHFSILTCVKLIDAAWQALSVRTLHSAWRNLWPANVPERDFEGFDAVCVPSDVHVIDDIVTMGKSMGLEMDTEDVTELVESHGVELTTEELLHLQDEETKSLNQELCDEEEEKKEDQIPSAVLKEMLASWAKLQDFVATYHPDIKTASRSSHLFNETMSHFRGVLQLRQKQQTIDRFFSQGTKRKASAESEPSTSGGGSSAKRTKADDEGRFPDVFMEGDSPSKM